MKDYNFKSIINRVSVQDLLNLLSFFIVSFMYFYNIVLFYITYLAKKRKDKGAFINNLANSIILAFSLTINQLNIAYLNPLHRDLIVFPFDILMSFFIIFFLPLFYIFMLNEKRKMKNQSKNGNIIDGKKQELPYKYDIYRKLTHLVVLGIIFFYFTLGFLIQNFFIFVLAFLPNEVSVLFHSLFSIENNVMIFTQFLVVFLVGISLIGLLSADFVRILKPRIYPLKPVNKILREKELHSRVGPQISMAIGCFSIILLYGLIQPIGPLIICLSMAISIFGDMSANLIGRRFGTIKIRETVKTYEGLFAEIISGFIAGMIFLLILRDLYLLSIIEIFFFPLIGALIIGFLDYLNLDIDDNLIFPFISSTILFFIGFFIW